MADPSQILAARNAEVERINNYADLTEEAKSTRIAAVNEKANAEYAEAQERQKQEREERLQRTQRAVFGVVDDATATTAERAQIHAAYRQAAGDVRWITMDESPGETQEELSKILTQAERTGDQLLAKAIFHHAIDLNLQPVVDSYLERRPKENRAWERYTEALGESHAATDITQLLSGALTERALNEG
jgi:hypothetical protein